MKKTLLFIILNSTFLVLNSFCFAQNKNTFSGHSRTVDSLLTLLKKDKADSNKVKHLNALGWALRSQNPDSAIILGNQALAIITPIHSPEFGSVKEGIEDRGLMSLRANTLSNLGTYYYLKSDYNRALDFYLKALKIDEELKNKSGIVNQLANIGIVLDEQADYPKALDFYLKALKVAEELGNKNRIATILGNIGIVFREQGDYAKALDYQFKALKIDEEIGNKNGIAFRLGNIAIIYNEQKDYPQALKYDFSALKVDEELNNKNGIARHLGNIGNVYQNQAEYPKALDYYFKALKMAEELGDKMGVARHLGNIGSLYTTTGKFKEAEQFLQKGMAISDSIGAKDYLMQYEMSLSELYDTTGQLKLALMYYKKAMALKDTLFSQENKKQLIRKEMNYEFDKKEAITKSENDKQQAIAEEKSRKQKIVLFLVLGSLILVITFAGFIFRSLRITRRQKNIIELQKNEVSKQKEIVEKQKEIVEKQKEKIVDSITYAQRIQQSVLMEESEIQNYLPECFIYFQPKDIVSGDFYWCSKIDDKIILAAVDCTGHGVPGAFMSMIGNTLLNQIVNEKHVTTPAEILRLLNIGIYKALNQKKDGALSRDGMDAALCCIDYKNNELQFAGAQNPLYMLLDNEVVVIKADRQTIGGGGLVPGKGDAMNIKYTNNVIPIKKDTSIYLFSDGYKDQFGGVERKKFGMQKFKELLLSNRHLSMQKQKELIVAAHTEWKRNTPQIDDILVMGIRI